MKLSIQSDQIPKAVGPYSQAIRMGNMIFCAGQIPIDPQSGELVSDEIRAQTEQVIKNIKSILDAAGLSIANVVKSTIFLTDLADFAVVNEIYASHFSAPFPARSTVQVAGLPKGAKVEIEVIAMEGAL